MQILTLLGCTSLRSLVLWALSWGEGRRGQCSNPVVKALAELWEICHC